MLDLLIKITTAPSDTGCDFNAANESTLIIASAIVDYFYNEVQTDAPASEGVNLHLVPFGDLIITPVPVVINSTSLYT